MDQDLRRDHLWLDQPRANSRDTCKCKGVGVGVGRVGGRGLAGGWGREGELVSRADRRGRWLKNTSNWKIIFAMMCTSRKENYSENQFVSYKKFGKSFCLALSFTDSLTHSCLCSTKPVKSLSAPLFGISCLYCQSSLSSVVFVVSCLCYQLSLSSVVPVPLFTPFSPLLLCFFLLYSNHHQCDILVLVLLFCLFVLCVWAFVKSRAGRRGGARRQSGPHVSNTRCSSAAQ